MSMGESTRRRLEGAVRGASGNNAPAQYVGGWQGGLGGTWGKAARGLAENGGAAAPAAAAGTSGAAAAAAAR